MAECIQHRLDDDVVDIPLFHGNDTLDTVKPSTFMDRIQQGINTLAWTLVQAFSYFRNALRNDADDWLHTIMYSHPEYALNWMIYKPLFCQNITSQQSLTPSFTRLLASFSHAVTTKSTNTTEKFVKP